MRPLIAFGCSVSSPLFPRTSICLAKLVHVARLSAAGRQGGSSREIAIAVRCPIHAFEMEFTPSHTFSDFPPYVAPARPERRTRKRNQGYRGARKPTKMLLQRRVGTRFFRNLYIESITVSHRRQSGPHGREQFVAPQRDVATVTRSQSRSPARFRGRGAGRAAGAAGDDNCRPFARRAASP